MDKVDKIVKKINDRAEIAIVLGSGFSEAMPKLTNVNEIEYKKLGLNYVNVSGHSRKFIFGDYNNKRILIFNRLHFYESGSLEEIRKLYFILSKLGVKLILMTTAVGAVNNTLNPTDLVLINDHINLTGQNPLIGQNPINFLDMKNAYDKNIIKLATVISKKMGIELKTGVHCQLIGPTYETPAEIKMLRKIGVDTVSMSSALDVILAHSLNIKVLLLAGVTNKASDLAKAPITHEEVLTNGKKMSKKIGELFAEIINTVKL